MAKQASKAKPGTRARPRAVQTKTASKPAASPRAAPKGGRKVAGAGTAATSAPPERSSASRRPATSPRAKGTSKASKLQAAGKALTSGHSAGAAKSPKDGRPSSTAKRGTTAGRAAVPGKKAAPPAPPKAGMAKKKPAKRVTFDRKTLSTIKRSLEDQRKDLMEQLQDIEEAAFSPSQTEASSEAGFDEDYADAGTATFEREKDLSIANNINNLVDKIDKALAKIEQGSYGICENCGQPISADRLKALPHVLLCINCKKAEERR